MKKISILILTLLVAMAACKKVPEVNKEYVDVERDLITVGTTTATIQCDYEYIVTLKKAFLYYGEGEDAADMNVTEMSVVQKTLYVELGGLKGNTTYSYYYEFVNGFNSMKSAVKAFKTEASSTTVTLPTVVTAEVTEITTNSAKGGGEVTNDGGAEVTERGICWSTNANPTISDSHVAIGTGTGSFSTTMSGLQASTTYHVRAYATNFAGASYGLDREFTTHSGGGSGVPEGAINGLFTINENGDQVYFSQGNLQYSKSTQTWSFMAHQYDIVEVEGQNVGVDYANQDIVSLFGWGTSGYDHGAIAFQPWSTSSSYGDYYAYGDWDYNLFDQTGMADWGYNAIVNGGNIENSGWRTLTCAEWDYVINIRNTKSGCRYAKAKVNGVNGIILLPYDWITSIYALNNTNGGTYNSNTISAEVWTNTLEANGAVFLPAAGLRNGSGFSFVESYGNYWSSSGLTGSNGAFGLYFGSDDLGVSGYDGTSGRSVRLVRDATSHPSNTTPTVVTSDVSNVTSNSAICGGEVTNDGGANVTESGICWSTNANPTLNDNHVTAGTGTGSFSATMNGLEANTTYHVRAYATNEKGTAYGLDKEFTTIGGGSSGAPEGAIDGLFSVSPTQKVYFSQGNLQYQASTNSWRFAENQWDYVGDATNGSVYENGVKCNNELISSTYKGWIDLFGWGTSGFGHGANCYQPWSTNTDCSDYFAYGNLSNGLFSQNGQADWGYNAISNGGNAINLWRTLTFEEFNYVFEFRQTSSNYRYVKATVNGIHGYLVFPDNWDPAVYEFNNVNDFIVIFDVNSITESDFEMLESRGVVFMPASGYRHITIVEWVHWDCYYWASNIINIGYAHSFNSNTDPDGHGFSWPFPDNPGSERYKGLSVRLVQNAN